MSFGGAAIKRVRQTFTHITSIQHATNADGETKHPATDETIRYGYTHQILAQITNTNIGAGLTKYVPNENGIDISMRGKKTVTVKADYALEMAIEVSDDGTDWDTYYSTTLTAGQMDVKSFDEGFLYVRVKLNNPDTSAHTINYCRIKGRGM